jgi:glycosyltransferase involved in cell wall biosynthesis
LRRSLASALRQENVELEVVVVDDGSTDETPEWLAGLEDQRVVVVRHETSRRTAGARNSGLARARGEWVGFLDDDDVWAPTKLRQQLDAAAEAGADWAYSGVVTVDERLDVLIPTEPPVAPDNIDRELLSRNVLTSGSNIFARREALERLGGFDTQFVLLDDWDLCLRLAAAYQAAACVEPLVAYVRHSGAHQVADADLVLSDFRRLARKHAAIGRRLDGVALARWAAGGHRRAGRVRSAVGVYLRSGLAFRSPGNVARALVVVAADSPLRGLRRRRMVSTPVRPAWLDRFASEATGDDAGG